MAYGIDQMVQDKADAYRGNPAALQKRSAMSKELIDMLALQKITSEKDAAARDMQLKMEQQPGTIAQQLEQKAVGQTKDEMLKGVAGVMQTNQAKQQANMQRAASAGIAGQPRPNMQMMAQGGVVGYANGGSVTEQIKKIQADRSLTKDEREARIRQIIASTPDAQSRQIMKDFGIGKKKTDLASPTIQDDPTLAPPSLIQYPMGKGVKKAPPYVPDAMGGTGDDMMRGLGGPAIESPEVKPDDGIAGLRAAVDNVPKPVDVPMPEDTSSISFDAAAYKPDMTQANEYKAGIADKFTGLMNQDPAEAAAAKRAEALRYMDYTDAEKTLRQANIDELKGLETKRYGSEDQLRRDRLIQNLISAGGSTVGGALASGARGSIAERDKQRAGIDSLMAARQKAEAEQMDKSQAIRKTAYGEGTSAENQAYENIRTGVSGLRGLSSDAEARAVADADRLASLNIAKENKSMQNRQMELQASLQIADQLFKSRDSKYKGDVTVAVKVIEATMAKEKNAITAQHNAAIEAIQEGQGRTQLTKVIATIGQVIGNIEKLYIDAYSPMLSEAAAQAGNKDYKGPTVAEIKAQIEKSVETSTQDLTTLLDDSKQRLDGGSSNDGYTVNTI